MTKIETKKFKDKTREPVELKIHGSNICVEEKEVEDKENSEDDKSE